jgi:hypothetical protein
MLLAFASVLAKGPRVLDDPDTYWHVVVGRWILTHHAVPHTDTFSHTFLGAAWVSHEWLAEVIMAWLYDHFGWSGLVVAAALSFALTFGLLARALLKWLPPWAAGIGVLLAWGLCFPHCSARPHVVALPLLVGWCVVLVTARSEDRAPPPYWALLMVPWANLHGGFVVGLALTALFAGEAAMFSRSGAELIRVAKQWGGFACLALIAALLTPHGVSGLLLPIQFARMDFVLSIFSEWRSPNFQEAQLLEAWLMLLLLGALLVGLRLPLTRIVMLLILLHMALQHRRHGEILGLVGALLAAPALGSQLQKYRINVGVPAWLVRQTVALPALAVAAVLLLAATVTAMRIPIARGADRITPTAAVAFARQHRLTGPVFNELNFGGYLIWSGIPTFIDGRAELYGNEFIRRYATPAELPRLLEQYRIVWTLTEPSSLRTTLLDLLPGWRRVYSDSVAVIHVREAPANTSLPD